MEQRSLKCPSCGLDNGADETYCDDCGALLTSSPVVLEQRLRQERLPVDTVVGEKYRVVRSAIDGVFNAYEAVHVDDGRAVRMLEDAEVASREPSFGAELSAPVDDDTSHAAVTWRALTSAQSEHLWKVLDFVYHEGRGFVVGAPLPQWDLQRYRRDTPDMTLEEIVACGGGILDALIDLHERGFLHLGVHPEHVYIDAEGVCILDGYERLARLDALPEIYSVVEGYSAPEAFGIGGTPAASSDVYGVGVTLYFLVSGQSPAAVSREQFFFFPPLSARVRGVPPSLEAVVMKALSKDMKARYQRATEMVEALDGVSLDAPVALEGLPDSASPPPAPEMSPSNPPAETSSAPSLPATSSVATPSPVAVAATLLASDGTGFLPCRIGMKSHKGCVRSVNQDSLLVMSFSAWEHSLPSNALLVVVADGMGGEAEGDKASSLAIRSMATHLLQNHIPVTTGSETRKLRPAEPVARLEELVRDSMETSNHVVFDYAQKDDARRGMGSTLTALMIDWPHAVFGHAGDTRAYLLRPGASEVDQVTEDHSLVGKLVRLGQLTREQARVSPQRSYLYRALGTQAELELDVYARTLEQGDRLLLCSDGVWEYYSESEIIEFLSHGDDPQETCERLIDETLRRGADDNATAVVVHITRAG